MVELLVSAATGALSSVLAKLAAVLGDEYKHFTGVRGEIRFLTKELAVMHAFLLRMSEEENPGAQDMAWVKEVRELSYDIEDSLDEFMLGVDDESTKPDGFIKTCKYLLSKTKKRRRIAKSIQDLKAQVKEIGERNDRYRIDGTAMKTGDVAIDPRALAIFEDASRLVAIDEPKHEVISFLAGEDVCVSSHQPTRMVSIVGCGGVGKTTLANQVYQELKKKFDCRAFLSVSRNPDMFRILRTILSQVTSKNYCETEAGSIQQLIMKINEFLQTRRYLIVVDDVWDVKTWDIIKCALSNNSCGSMIITTTRRHDVAKACCSSYCGLVYKSKLLKEQDSKRLFLNRIFGRGEECPETFNDISHKILKKCGGLPLAVIAISGLLANKARNGVHSVAEWDQVETSIGHGLERDTSVEEMMGILSLSYFDLPYHLKACLLYLSVFPEDHEIEKQSLVRRWVAEGFIPMDFTCTLYESGEKCFNELINRNLILPRDIDKFTGQVNSCLVHDIIFDFIVCKSTEDNFITVHGVPRLAAPSGIKVRRLSLQGTQVDGLVQSNRSYSNVRSLCNFCDSVGSPCSLLGFRFLRVLDIGYCHSIESHHLADIGELFQLRYLSLSCITITELPEQIGELRHLETLDLRGCYKITKLPTTIVQLKRLINLLMDSVVPLRSMPVGITNLQALEELNCIKVDIKGAATCFEQIGELSRMRNLGMTWCLDPCLDKGSQMEYLKKMVSSVQRLNKIQILNVKFRYTDVLRHEDMIFDDEDVMLVEPWCSTSLRKLALVTCPMSRVPIWMKSIVNIEELDLALKEFEQEGLYILGSLPVLVILRLNVVTKAGEEGRPSSADGQRLVVSRSCGYKSLRYFKIGNYVWGSPITNPMLRFEAGSMPELAELSIDFNADVTISAINNGRLDFGLKHPAQLTRAECCIFGSRMNVRLLKIFVKKELQNHPKHPDFRIKRMITSQSDQMSHRIRLRPQRHCRSTPQAIADDLSGREVAQEAAADHAVATDASGGEMIGCSTTDGDIGRSFTAALPLPQGISFALDQHHHDATASSRGPRHGGRRRQRQRRCRSTPCQGGEAQRLPLAISTVSGGQGSLVIPDQGAASASNGLGPAFVAAPQQQTLAMRFAFNTKQPALDCHEPSRNDIPQRSVCACKFGGDEMIGCSTNGDVGWSFTAALPLPQDISFALDQHYHGAIASYLGPRRGRRRQQQRRSTPGQGKPQRPPPAVATVSGGQGSLAIPDQDAASASNGLGPGFIAARH
ncbi:hypothetical protein ACP4OV_016299 [Aristida adscensionis]